MRTAAFLLVLASSLTAQTPEKLFQERKFDEAGAAAKAALASNKNDHGAMFVLGRIAENQNKHDDAIGWFEKCVKLDDKNAQYHYWLGGAVGSVAQNASKLKQPFLARRVKSEFEKAVALDPKLIDARQGLADFYQMAPGFMGGSNAKAREQVDSIRKLNPYRGHLSGAIYAQRDKDWAGAAKEYEAAIALHPDTAQAYYNLTGLYRRQSQWPEALAVYDRLMKAKPDELIAHLGWGATAAQSGNVSNYDRGERELRTFIAAATLEKAGMPNLAGSHFRLGQILEKTSRRDQAKAEYQEALKINPQHADAKKALDALK